MSPCGSSMWEVVTAAGVIHTSHTVHCLFALVPNYDCYISYIVAHSQRSYLYVIHNHLLPFMRLESHQSEARGSFNIWKIHQDEGKDVVYNFSALP